MIKIWIAKTLVIVLVSNLLTLGVPQAVRGEVIGTETLLRAEQRDQQLHKVDRFLAREDVQARLVEWGVDPAEASQRVAALSDSELQQITQRLDALPAGGTSALAVIGVVFVVLLILELVGITNIFTSL